MSIQIKVPTIACEGCVETITKAIKNNSTDAEITVDMTEKIVTVETQSSEATIKESILATGHEIADR